MANKMPMSEIRLKQSLFLGGWYQQLKRIVMSKIFLVLLACIAIAYSSKPNYQERQVYYKEDENVCDHPGFEWVKLAISIDGQPKKELSTKIRTFCDQGGATDGQRIVVPTKWSYYDDLNDLKFDDKTYPKYEQDTLVGIVVRTTLRSPATINGKQYDCRIIGNGEILHYGSDSGNSYEHPTISISCNSPEEVQ